MAGLRWDCGDPRRCSRKPQICEADKDRAASTTSATGPKLTARPHKSLAGQAVYGADSTTPTGNGTGAHAGRHPADRHDTP